MLLLSSWSSLPLCSVFYDEILLHWICTADWWCQTIVPIAVLLCILFFSSATALMVFQLPLWDVRLLDSAPPGRSLMTLHSLITRDMLYSADMVQNAFLLDVMAESYYLVKISRSIGNILQHNFHFLTEETRSSSCFSLKASPAVTPSTDTIRRQNPSWPCLRPGSSYSSCQSHPGFWSSGTLGKFCCEFLYLGEISPQIAAWFGVLWHILRLSQKSLQTRHVWHMSM